MINTINFQTDNSLSGLLSKTYELYKGDIGSYVNNYANVKLTYDIFTDTNANKAMPTVESMPKGMLGIVDTSDVKPQTISYNDFIKAHNAKVEMTSMNGTKTTISLGDKTLTHKVVPDAKSIEDIHGHIEVEVSPAKFKADETGKIHKEVDSSFEMTVDNLSYDKGGIHSSIDHFDYTNVDFFALSDVHVI